MIFRNNQKASSQGKAGAPQDEEATPVIQPKPKVLLVDMESSAEKALRDIGINATAGTFGTSYRVPVSSSYEAVRNSARLPGYSEQEIIFIDLAQRPAAGPVGDVVFALDTLGVWISCKHGVVDPRFRAAAAVQKDFERILAAGGVIVVFATGRSGVTAATGKIEFGNFYKDQTIDSDEWGFLSQLDYVEVSSAHGEEIVVCEPRSLIGKVLSDVLPKMQYECTLALRYNQNKQWTTLATNKFGEAVSLAYLQPGGGAVIILPQVDDKVGLAKALLADVLPELAPSLFPGNESARWTHLPEYELTGVAALEENRQDAIAKHELAMKELDADIHELRTKDGWLHDLLTQTGDPLVHAVMAALADLGYENVVDMDKLRDKDGKQRREDLRVLDISPTLVVDIKGISNFPGDEDAMQAFKHATLAMREEKRTDIYSLSLINHQRHLPPLTRENAMPYRQELVDIALENEQGLMTTWDLYRLVVNKRRNSWRSEDVKPVLYRFGRIEPIPEHYTPIGRVAHVWKHGIGIELEAGSVHIGQKVAMEFGPFFEEAVVPSLRVNDVEVAEAIIGDKTGIPWPDTKSRPKVGMLVYAATPPESSSPTSSASQSPTS